MDLTVWLRGALTHLKAPRGLAPRLSRLKRSHIMALGVGSGMLTTLRGVVVFFLGQPARPQRHRPPVRVREGQGSEKFPP